MENILKSDVPPPAESTRAAAPRLDAGAVRLSRMGSQAAAVDANFMFSRLRVGWKPAAQTEFSGRTAGGISGTPAHARPSRRARP